MCLQIQEHGKRADGVVRAMLLLSRGQSGEIQKTDINRVLSEALSLIYHGLRAQDSTFKCAPRSLLDPSLGEISVVPQQLSRVFLNIINNACYAVHQKSKASGSSYAPEVAVSTTRAPRPRVSSMSLNRSVGGRQRDEP